MLDSAHNCKVDIDLMKGYALYNFTLPGTGYGLSSSELSQLEMMGLPAAVLA